MLRSAMHRNKPKTNEGSDTSTRGDVVIADVTSSAQRLGRRTIALLLAATLAPLLLACAAFGYLRDAALTDAQTRLQTVLDVAVRHADSMLQLNSEIARLLAQDIGATLAQATLAQGGAAHADLAARTADPQLAMRLAAIPRRHAAVGSVMVRTHRGTSCSIPAAAQPHRWRCLASTPCPRCWHSRKARC